MTKSIRLNESKRKDILNSILSEWDRNNTLHNVKELKFQAAEEIYDSVFSSSLLSKLTDPEIKEFIYYGENFLASVVGSMDSFSLKDKRPMPRSGTSWQGPVIKVLDKKTDTLLKIDELENENYKLLEQKEKLKKEVSEILASVSSTKELIELWPEVEDLIPAYLANPSKVINLPAIPVSKLNEALKLTKKED